MAYTIREKAGEESTRLISARLEGEEHAALRILSRNAKEEDVRNILEQSRSYRTQGDIENANAVLQVSVTANGSLYSMIRGDEVMCQALMDLMKDEILWTGYTRRTKLLRTVIFSIDFKN